MVGNSVKIGQKVSKRGIIVGKRAEIENTYLNTHLLYQYEFKYMSRKSFEWSRRSSNNKLFLMRTSKGRNPTIRGQIKKW